MRCYLSDGPRRGDIVEVPYWMPNLRVMAPQPPLTVFISGPPTLENCTVETLDYKPRFRPPLRLVDHIIHTYELVR